MDSKLLKTPLHSLHASLGARMVPFAGFEMPVQYSGLLEETKACRATGGIFDVSHMGQISIQGPGALESFQKLVTNDLTRLSPNQVQYHLLCNPEGGVIDDILVYLKSSEELFLCVNASNRSEDFHWIREQLPKNISVTDESDSFSLIAVQGPQAHSLIQRLAPRTLLEKLFYYGSTPATVGGISVLLSRTGYTGEDGFELYVQNEQAAPLWETLISEGNGIGMIPCGLGARDTLRLEMGYPLHGHELSKSISPLQAGLQWAVKLNSVKEFVGRSALVNQLNEGVSPVLKAFLVEDKRMARQDYPIANLDHKIIGKISSGTFSPHLNQPIALGFVHKEASQENAYFVKIRNDWIPMSSTALPFVPGKVRKPPR